MDPSRNHTGSELSTLKPAYRNDWTAGTFFEVPLPRAIACDSQMAKRKVVPERIVRMQPAKALCNIQRHPPAGISHRRQSDVGGDSSDMRVQRNDQLPWRHAAPYAAV